MADARRRTLARQGAKDLPVEVALLRQRMRSGELTHDAVVLLALLFHEPAEQLLGQPAEEGLCHCS